VPEVIPVQGLFIPGSLQDAQSIIPDVEPGQIEKWARDSAVELELKSVYVFRSTTELTPCDFAAILRDGTVTPEVIELEKTTIAEVVAEVQGEAKRLERAFVVLEQKPCQATPSDLVHAIVYRLLRCRPVFVHCEELPRLLTQDETFVDVELEGGGFYRLVLRRRRLFKGWALVPKFVYLLKLQYVKIPCDMLPEAVQFRSSFHRCCWIGKITNVDPGFEGHLYVLLMPAHRCSPVLILEENCRVAQMRLVKLSAPLGGYSGQWKYE